MSDECEFCIKRKTMYCPNSELCYSTKDKPYYQNRNMALEENKELQLELSGYRQAILNNDKLLGLQQRIDTVRNMLWCLENYTLTRERLNQLDEVLLGISNI